MSRLRRSPPPPQLDAHREKAMRSIFVANISFETTEDEMRAILSEVGPVVSLKLIQDPVTGKPRGFGFCEYEDAETALSACRNLAGREVNGRGLRIDSAMNAPGGEGFRPPVGGVTQPTRIEPPLHGPAIPPENAPEAITKAVASLPPEHMYELMKQIKWCVQNNPEETRQLLIHNPQLAYALLQAQVVMRIVDLDTAQNLLHRSTRGQPMQPTGPLPPPPPPPHHGNQPTHHHGNQPSHHPPPIHSDHPHHHSDHPPMGRHGPPPPRHGDRFRPPPPGRDWHPGSGPPPSHASRGGPRFPGPPPSNHPPSDINNEEQEKTALLMQVLSLTDEQIQMLPPDQRNNILRLKEQLSHTT